MTSLNDLKRMVDDALDKCNGEPIASFPIKSGTRLGPVEIEIVMQWCQKTQQYQPTINFYAPYKDEAIRAPSQDN